MSAHVLLNLLNELRKRDKMLRLPSIYCFFATSLINSILCNIDFLENKAKSGKSSGCQEF